MARQWSYDLVREHLQVRVIAYVIMYYEPLNSWTAFETNLGLWRLISRILATTAQDAKRQNTALGKRGFYLYSLPTAGMAPQIVAEYSNGSVQAVLGSNVTFTWKYVMTGAAGSQPEIITWGLGLRHYLVKVPLVTAQPSGVTINSNLPPKYKGRVAWTGDWAKQEASFSLSNVTRADEAVYGFYIAFDPFTSERDSVQLKVLGKCDGCLRSLSWPFWRRYCIRDGNYISHTASGSTRKIAATWAVLQSTVPFQIRWKLVRRNGFPYLRSIVSRRLGHILICHSICLRITNSRARSSWEIELPGQTD